MKNERMNELLHELAQEAIPADINLWRGVQARIEAQRRAPGQRRLPVARFGWAMAVLVVLLSFATAAYAIDPTVNKLFRQFVGLSTPDQNKYIKDLDIEQTIDGITVTVQAVYADANQILIGLAVKTADGKRYSASDYRLTTDDGTVLDEAMGVGVSGESELLNVKLKPGEQAEVVTFDASKIKGSPDRLKLHLQVKMQEFPVIDVNGGTSYRVIQAGSDTDPQGGPVTVMDSNPGASTGGVNITTSGTVTLDPNGSEQHTTTSDSTQDAGSSFQVSGTQVSPGKTVGPFAFDFEVPFIAGRMLELNDTATAADIEMRLKQVTITPSQIRATLCFTPPQPGAWTILAEMEPKSPIAGGVSMLPISGTSQECQTVRVPRPDVSTTDWTLKVNELLKFNAPFDGKQERIQGPWVFHLPQQ